MGVCYARTRALSLFLSFVLFLSFIVVSSKSFTQSLHLIVNCNADE